MVGGARHWGGCCGVIWAGHLGLWRDVMWWVGPDMGGGGGVLWSDMGRTFGAVE